MPQLCSLTPPSENSAATLRQCATAPNLHLMNANRFANLEIDSPALADSPPHPSVLQPMKFYPLPSSKYRQLSAVSLNQISNFSTSPPKIHVDFAQKASFTVGSLDEHDSRSGCSSRSDVPMLTIQSCDTPVGTPRGTPMGSPQLLRKRSIPENIDRRPSGSGGFLGWLTRSSVPPVRQESEFFHQKEDMPSLQGLTNRSQGPKPRSKMPVSLADINVFTPSEY